MHCKNCGTKLHLVDEVDQEEILEHIKNQGSSNAYNIYDENEKLRQELADLNNKKSDQEALEENKRLKKEIEALKSKKK